MVAISHNRSPGENQEWIQLFQSPAQYLKPVYLLLSLCPPSYPDLSMEPLQSSGALCDSLLETPMHLMLPGSAPAEAMSSVSTVIWPVCSLQIPQMKFLLCCLNPQQLCLQLCCHQDFTVPVLPPKQRLYLQDIFQTHTVKQQQSPKTWILHNPQRGVWQ